MPFTEKNWVDSPSTSTPISAAALEDLETRLSDYTDDNSSGVSLTSFGTTGTVDDTSVFAAARDGVGVGGHVYVPPGTYIVSTVTLTVAHQTWEFAPGAIIKTKAGSDSAAFSIRAEYITILGGEWDGNRTNVTDPTSGVIQPRASHCKVLNAYVHDTDGYGVHATPLAAGTAVDDILVTGCTFLNTQGDAVYFNYSTATTPSKGLRIESCWSDNSAVAAASVAGGGFQIFGPNTAAYRPNGCAIKNCYANSRADAVTDVAGISLFNCAGAAIQDCESRNHSMESYAVGDVSDVVVSGCVAYGAQDYGIELGGLTRAVVNGNTVNGNAVLDYGIALTAVSTDVTIAGNTIDNLDTVGRGIASTATMTRLVVANNTIQATNRCIGLGADPVDTSITGNLCVGDGASWGILADDATTGTKNWSIRTNQFVDCATAGILFYSGSSKTYSNVDTRGNTYWNCGAHVSTTNVTLDGSCLAD